MTQEVTVRTAGVSDGAAIHEVHALAFERQAEARLVDTLIAWPGFVPELSLVALCDGRVAGHILFTPIEIVRNDRPVAPSLALAPLAVRPSLQNLGVGSHLVRAGLDACRRHGAKTVIVVGHPNYYPRFGFRDARPQGLEIPFEASDGAFMICELQPGAGEGLRGIVTYPAPFYVDDL